MSAPAADAAATQPAVVDDTTATQNKQDEPVVSTETTETDAQVQGEAAASTDVAMGDAPAEKEGSAGPMLKTTSRINKEDKKSNVKFDPSTQPVTDDHNKIRKQVWTDMVMIWRSAAD
jgi:lupus La protein